MGFPLALIAVLVSSSAKPPVHFDGQGRILDSRGQLLDDRPVAGKVEASSGGPATSSPLASGSWCTDPNGAGGSLTFTFDPPAPVGWVAVSLGTNPSAAKQVEIFLDSGETEKSAMVSTPTKVVDFGGAIARSISFRISSSALRERAGCLSSIDLIAPGPFHYALVAGVDGQTLQTMNAAVSEVSAAFATANRKAIGRLIHFPIDCTGCSAGEESNEPRDGPLKDIAALVKGVGLPDASLKKPAIPQPKGDDGFSVNWSEDTDHGQCRQTLELTFTKQEDHFQVTAVGRRSSCDG